MRRLNRGLLGDQGGTEDTKEEEFENLLDHGFPENDHGLSDVELSRVPMWSKILSCWPMCWCNSCFTLEPREEAIVLHFGSLTQVEKRAGIHFMIPAGASVRKVSTKQRTCALPDCKITDSSGNPVICSAVLNYRVCNGKQSLMNVQNVDQFVRTNATAVLKQIVSRHTYDECKKEASEMNMLMRTALQQRVRIGGVNVGSMEINELNYAPEIASGMLKKQQAMALVAARHVIVDGATEIAKGAIRNLESGEQGMKLSSDEKAKIVTNLLTITCGDSDAVPTLSL
eukprot:g3416.t1